MAAYFVAMIRWVNAAEVNTYIDLWLVAEVYILLQCTGREQVFPNRPSGNIG